LYGDASDDPSKSIASNRVTFTNETKDGTTTLGSISVSSVAANIKFDDDVLAADNATDLKKKSLLTIDFQNEPTVDVPEIDAAKKAHIYAKNTNGSATALQLSDNVNLKFTGSSALFPELSVENLANQKRAGIFAYSSKDDKASVGIDVGSTTGIGDGITTFDREIIFEVPTEIYAKIEGSYYVAAAAIGQARGEGIISLDSNIRYVIANNNEFVSSSSSSSYSASTVIGAASGDSSSTVRGNNVFDIGTNSLFASSSSYYYSASTVIGAASGDSNSTVSGNNVFDIGINNLFTSSSFSSSYSASTVIGAASGDSSSTVSGNNVFDIGTNNLFASSSFSSYSASTVIGAASGDSSSTVSGNNV
ncbi:MAG: hypothetical protein K2L13_01775, partial [Opitutales bacterium]|nr:hypothetical protein [Opitutales bacterium]